MFEAEKQTESYDSEAVKKLSYVLIPLVLAGAVYQLLFSTYKRLVLILISASSAPKCLTFLSLSLSLSLSLFLFHIAGTPG